MGRGRTAVAERAPVSVTLSDAMAAATPPLIARFAARKHGDHLTALQEEAVITLLAMHDGQIRPVARMAGLSQTVVWDIKHANMVAFSDKREVWKKHAALESQEVFMEATAQVRERLPDASARDAAVIAGIYADKGAMLAGEGTNVNLNVTHRVDPVAIAAVADRLREIMGSRPADTLEAEFTVVDDA